MRTSLFLLQKVTFYGSSIWRRPKPVKATCVEIPGMKNPALVHGEGMLLLGSDNVMVSAFLSHFENQ